MSFSSKIYKFLVSSDRHMILLKLMLFLVSIFVIMILTRKKRLFSSWTNSTTEGFEQQDAFILKRGDEAYDDFYVQVYDHLFESQHRAPFEIEALESTQPDTKNAIILDLACGTGCYVSELVKKGYKYVYGVDKHEPMISLSRKNHPEAKTKLADVSTPMEFEPETFTHIACNHFAIYQYQDKHRIFSNVSRWLIPQGYLLLHLVNPSKFDPIPPAGQPEFGPKIRSMSGDRVTETLVDFNDFTYKSTHNFSNLPEVVVTETFEDVSTKHIRQNEHMLWMESIEHILAISQRHGFATVGKMALKSDENQFVYILQKTNM